MGRISCKNSEIIENTNPHISRKQSRWRCVVGLEAKGLELDWFILNYQTFRKKNLQIVDNTRNTTIEE